MNSYLKNQLIEVAGANNISYILNDNKDFSVTGYKVMQNQSSSGLLRCAKVMYNGKIKLVYLIESYKPLSYVATRLGVNELNAVIFNLIQKVLDIKSNGFFRAENIELNFDKIFIDTSDYSVHLIYLPISNGNTGKISSFENEFRIALINLFNSFPIFNAPQFQRLCSDLSNGSMNLNTILKRLQDNINGHNYLDVNGHNDQSNQDYFSKRVNLDVHLSNNPNDDKRCVPAGYPPNKPPVVEYMPAKPQPAMTISAINSYVQFSLVVNIPEYLIGKNPNMVNGVITYNPAISRVHCQISYIGGKYYLTDKGSANGTFCNQQRLEAENPIELHSGDNIRLANSDFIVTF